MHLKAHCRPSALSYASGVNMPKRRSTIPTSTGEEGEQQKRKNKRRTSPAPAAPPPPPPPESLVNLIKSDAAVLQYFTALQASLKADVDAWKDKAQEYKREAVRLRRQNGNGNANSSSRKRSAKGVDSTVPKAKAGANRKENRARRQKNVRQSRKSSTSLNLSDTDASAVSASAEQSDNEEAISDEDEYPNVETISQELVTYRSAAIASIKEKLSKVHGCLERFNVLLVDKIRVPTDGGNVDAINSQNGEGKEDEVEDVPRYSFARRSDEVVVEDLVRILRSLVRVSQSITDMAVARRYQPFSTDGHFWPCCYSEYEPEPHPAREGLSLMIDILAVFDTYCGPAIGDILWDDIFAGAADADADEEKNSDPVDEVLERIRIGMQGRKGLVHSTLSSISGEISKKWAAEDRNARLGMTLYNEEEGIDGKGAASGADYLPLSTYQFDARSFNRLSILADRILHARLTSALLVQRGSYEEVASLVLEYIIVSSPCLDDDENSPALSFCVLEALLYEKAGVTGCSFDELLRGRTVSLCLGVGASRWSQVLCSSTDRRTRDVAQVEIAAYKRLSRERKTTWLSENTTLLSNTESEVCSLAKNIVLQTVGNTLHDPVEASISLLLALVMIGDKRILTDSLKQIFQGVETAMTKEYCFAPANLLLVAFCKAYRVIQSRQYHIQITEVTNNQALMEDSITDICELQGLDDTFHILENKSSEDQFSGLASTLTQCFLILSDGHGIDRMMDQVETFFRDKGERRVLTKSVEEPEIRKNLANFINVASFPTVRVINLRRRKDRWMSMIDQARRAHICVVRGIACINTKIVEKSDKEFWGGFAFDGEAGLVECGKQMDELNRASIGTSCVKDYVALHWHPNELAAFDTRTKRGEAPVSASSSERACALSHVASWIGIKRSLTMPHSSLIGGSIWHHYVRHQCVHGISSAGHASSIRQLFRISGFATGPPLLNENKNMLPAPVCIVLEDDAILVDRFADKLALLLLELPRDFHYCSLGYGRPKNAPIVEFSSTVGLPSFLWYLTGYILSLEGAEKLLNDLPVVGPVDAWIGLKIASNWHNAFGEALGVGRDARKSNSNSFRVPPKKELAKIMKFRAFAALVPLCSQKVGTSSRSNTCTGGDSSSPYSIASVTAPEFVSALTSVPKRRGGWRNRDTDITYSGSQ